MFGRASRAERMRRLSGGLALVSVLALPVIAAAQPARHTRVALLPETEWVQPGRPFWVALRLEMDEHWHTYWIHPGDSGLPTRLTWQLPEGFEAGEIQWPRPIRFTLGPLTSYGYADEVLLPVEITPPASLEGDEVTLEAIANWLECEEICLPGRAPVAVTLPVRDATPELSRWAGDFARTRGQLPAEPFGWGLEGGERDGTVALSVTPPAGWEARPGEAWFYPDADDVIEHSQPQRLVLTGDGYRLEMPAAEGREEALEHLSGVLVADAGGPDGGELVLAVSAALSPRVAEVIGSGSSEGGASAGLGLPLAVLFSFLGGLLLNLMPCVLPVLSLKVLAFCKDGGGEPRRSWHLGLAFTAGVLVVFWILAGALLALQAGGEQVGWGFQLQSPGFVAFLTFLFFLIGLNLFGVFEVGMSLSAAGAAADTRTGLAGSFWSGALATIVATPCTAPFMGSALGFALGQSAATAMLIFSALGLGMAFPYLLLARFPALLRFVPKPGPWMVGFKQLMGFFIMATVVALLWVFGRQVGVNAMSLMLAALVVVGMGGWIYGRATAPGATPRRRAVSLVAAGGLVLAGILLGLSQAQAAPSTAVDAADRRTDAERAWEEWSPERLAELREQGRPVLVDFTADWCLTCQVNERVAFTAAVHERFEAEGVALLRADWTLRDDTITRALAEHGRQGVPLYVLYGRAGEEPRLLPQILSPQVVLDALDEL